MTASNEDIETGYRATLRYLRGEEVYFALAFAGLSLYAVYRYFTMESPPRYAELAIAAIMIMTAYNATRAVFKASERRLEEMSEW